MPFDLSSLANLSPIQLAPGGTDPNVPEKPSLPELLLNIFGAGEMARRRPLGAMLATLGEAFGDARQQRGQVMNQKALGQAFKGLNVPGMGDISPDLWASPAFRKLAPSLIGLAQDRSDQTAREATVEGIKSKKLSPADAELEFFAKTGKFIPTGVFPKAAGGSIPGTPLGEALFEAGFNSLGEVPPEKRAAIVKRAQQLHAQGLKPDPPGEAEFRQLRNTELRERAAGRMTASEILKEARTQARAEMTALEAPPEARGADGKRKPFGVRVKEIEAELKADQAQTPAAARAKSEPLPPPPKAIRDPKITSRILQLRSSGMSDQQIGDALKAKGVDPSSYGL